MIDTLGFLAQAGIATSGAGIDRAASARARIVVVRGWRVAFIGMTTVPGSDHSVPASAPSVFFPADVAEAAESIRSVRPGADVVVVHVHHGVEYEKSERDEDRAFLRAVADAGADVVVGHHPHVARGVEVRGNSVIAHSLGNFIFDHTEDPGTDSSFLLEITLSVGAPPRWRAIPFRIKNAVPTIVSPGA